MDVKKIKQFCALVIASLIFAGAPALSAPPKTKRIDKKPNTFQQDTITITCPDVLVAVFQMPEGWSTFGGGLYKKNFVEAGVSDAQITCAYGERLDEILFRPVPKGYRCEIYKSGGSRPKIIECRRAKPPIKIKP